MSGKGGTGKSTLSAAVSLSLAKLGHSVLLVDLDIGLRSLDIMLGLENKVIFDIGDVLVKSCKLDDALINHDVFSSLKLLCSPMKIEKTFDIPNLIELLGSQTEKFDYVILDLPAGIGLSVIIAKALATMICVVTIPDEVTIRDTKSVCDAIFSSCTKDVRLVINRVSKIAMRTSGITDLDQILDTVGVPLLGVILEEQWIKSSISRQKTTSKVSSNTISVFNAIAKRIEGTYVPLIVRTV